MKFDFPALVLLIIFALGAWILWKTQDNPDNDFDFADMLRDEFGKPSAFRLGIFVSLGVSTWVLMYILVTNDGNIDTWAYIAYMAVWSGAKVADKLVDAYSGRLPDSRTLQGQDQLRSADRSVISSAAQVRTRTTTRTRSQQTRTRPNEDNEGAPDPDLDSDQDKDQEPFDPGANRFS